MNDHIIGWFLQTFNGLDYAKMYDITITSLKNSRYANVKLQKILIGLTKYLSDDAINKAIDTVNKKARDPMGYFFSGYNPKSQRIHILTYEFPLYKVHTYALGDGASPSSATVSSDQKLREISYVEQGKNFYLQCTF